LAKLACEPGVSVARLAMEHGLNPNLVFKWHRVLRAGDAFASDDVAVGILPITGRPSLFPCSYTRNANNVPCGSPALGGNVTGLPCSTWVSERVGSFLFAGGVPSMMVQHTKTMPCRLPFGSSLSAHLACSMMTTF